LFGDKVQVRHIPLDLPGCVRRFFDRVKPRIAIIFETELWPNLYHECGRRRVPLVLASARVSPRSVGRYRRMAGLFRGALSHDIVIAAQGSGDAERFRSIGANPARTHVTGNIKFDIALSREVTVDGRALRELHAPGRKVWIAGSTHDGEEQMVLAAHRQVRHAHPDALLMLAPRHPNRFAAVEQWLKREDVRFVKRSQGIKCNPATEVLLVDTLGELVKFYAASDIAFVGGSLVPIGGHNLLEPASLGLAILTGPHNFNSEDVARLLAEQGASDVVRDTEELGRKVIALFDDPQARARMGAQARNSIEANRGALGNLLRLIAPLIA
jgi:3-deoxy-D-manno-octulosonic-acid transferase